MTNPQGTPIWYELLTRDPDAAKAFYDHVAGWTIEAQPSGELDYRMIDTGHDGLVGGVMRLTDEMAAGGAKPTWLVYFGVDDVDATVEKARSLGAAILMPPWTIEGVGRMAFLADPQGAPFYVMRGASDEDSTAFDRMGMGKCNWNELATTDQASANTFYAELLGFTYPDKMAMGEMGDYWFVQAGDQTIGATMNRPGHHPAWQVYFRTPDIEATADKVRSSGGQVLFGPTEVPGGDRIIVAMDAEGVPVGFVGPGESA